MMIDFGTSLEKIGERAFANCSSMGMIMIPKTVTSIGSKAFSDTSIDSFIIQAKVSSFSDDAFYRADVYEFYYPNKFSNYVDIVDPTYDYGYNGTFEDYYNSGYFGTDQDYYY